MRGGRSAPPGKMAARNIARAGCRPAVLRRRRRLQAPRMVPAARPAWAQNSGPESFLPSSGRSVSTSIWPPWVLTKMLRSPMSVTAPILPLTAEKVRAGCLRASSMRSFLPLCSGPCARRRDTAPDQVVDVVDVIVPVDPGLGIAAPALVARLRFVLDASLALPLITRSAASVMACHSHGEQPVEINAPQRIVGTDRRLLLQNHRTLVQAVARTEDA